ncbi:MAG: acetyl-CoA carboxylase biotin carboxyl carrier protein [Treponema sp.]|nr:acetyl-CoA carboxylase biotin carboxyl carrier protein [Treponema sp.]
MDDKFFLAMVDKFNSSSIAEMDFNDGNVRLLLRKDAAFRQSSISNESVIPIIQIPAKQDAPVHLGIAAQAADGGEKIKSPIVATFYSSPNPDAPPFVKQGTKVKKGQTLCILEAMKMMNHLEAEFDCEIVEIHAASGELVEFGQELFTVKK